MTLLFGLLFFGQLLAGESVEVGQGAITQHYVNNTESGPRYSGKLNERGLIAHYLLSFSYSPETTEKHTFFYGNNSVALPMYGYKYTSFIYQGKLTDVGFFLGGYWQDPYAFTEKSGLVPIFTLGGLTPIFGIEVNFNLYTHKNFRVQLNNNLTPILSTHALTLGFDLW